MTMNQMGAPTSPNTLAQVAETMLPSQQLVEELEAVANETKQVILDIDQIILGPRPCDTKEDVVSNAAGLNARLHNLLHLLRTNNEAINLVRSYLV